MNNTNNGSLMQVFANESSINRFENVAINFQTYTFTNDRLTLSRNVDKITPEYLILDLFDSTADDLQSHIKDVYVSFEIGGQRILDFPLSLMWNFKQHEIVDGKLYLYFPFKELFGTLYLHALHYHEAVFRIINYHNLVNYARDCSLLCKTTICGNRSMHDPSNNNFIQQISSLEVSVSSDDTNALQTELSREFTINTNMFQSYIKGFLIECATAHLNQLQFYINGHIRTNYNRFLLRNKCVYMSENMMYFPFNDEVTFEDRNNNSCRGAINFSNLDRTVICLTFNTLQPRVKMYAVGMNNYIQTRGMGRLEFETNMYHLRQDFTMHPLLTPEQIVSHAEPIHNTRRNIINNNIINRINTNNIINNTYGNYTPGYFQSSYSSITDSSMNSITINNTSNQEIMMGRLIPQEKRMCGISLDEIHINDRYMCCSMCANNFKEHEIKRWLEDRRTCPSCRAYWSDNQVYLNVDINITA